MEPWIDEDSRVAIIGMAGLFPGARDVAAFWRNVSGGVESITTFSDAELAAAGVSLAELADPDYVKAGAVLEDIEAFDAGFFGLAPREVQIIDPQQRLFLETAWTALEAAGCDPGRLDGSVGVFAGAALSTYLINNLLPNPDVAQFASRMQLALGNDKDSLATWTAYALDLRGPCYTVQSYCSTSLVAVSAACTSLVAGDCDLALAGGVAISVPHRVGYRYQEGGIASPDARCRAFDADAKGAPLGNGAGVVVLKRLADARADGDHVHAVIRGWAVNNDGAAKAGYTAPGVRGQSDVISEALANADVDPATVDYIEAHGTGTALGDAVEFAALRRAFAAVQTPGSCVLGSVKTNVGHLDRAAGVTGLIKTALAMEHRELPPTLHFTVPNPQLQLESSAFRVQSSRQPWPVTDHPRRAGVSAFGIGGTNAHVVLEEAPEAVVSGSARDPQLLLLSARSAAAADARARELGEHLQANPEVELADVAWTLQVGRKEFEHRRAVVARDVADAATALTDPASGRVLRSADVAAGTPVALVFAGVGEQYVGWAAGVYADELVFRDVVDECCAELEPLIGVDLRPVLFAPRVTGGVDLAAMLGRGAPDPAAGLDALSDTVVAQPAVFVVEYALARLLESWGLRPDALAGYSLGEYVAATIAGVLSLPDALRLVAHRARLISALPAGGMVALGLSATAATELLHGSPTFLDVDVAAVNGPTQCVVAGPPAAVSAVQKLAAERGIPARALATTHAFHSRMLAPIAEELTGWVAEHVRLRAPTVRYASNVTGGWVSAAEVTDPGYWARHMCSPVRFDAVAAELLADPDRVLVEVGPGVSLGALVRQQPGCDPARGGRVVATLPAAADPTPDVQVLHAAVARLWLAGVRVDWAGYAGGPRRRVPLPTYPFQRDRYWIDPPAAGRPAGQPAVRTAPDPDADPRDLLAALPRLDIDRWCYQPTWSQTVLPTVLPTVPTEGAWLVLADRGGVADAALARLQRAGAVAVRVDAGPAYGTLDGGFVLRPGEQEDYARLLADLHAAGIRPRHILHLWSLDAEPADPHEALAWSTDRSYLSTLWLAQALGASPADPADLVIASAGAYDVTGVDEVHPNQALVTGPCRVVPLEFGHLSCRQVDMRPPTVETPSVLADQLLAECAAPAPAAELVAWRGRRRFLRDFRPLPTGETPTGALREHGVYLITGGLGGVGLSIAEGLAGQVRARLVLLARSPLPPRAEWVQLAQDPRTPADLARRIEAVERLEQAGAEVLVLAADVADPSALRAALETTRRTYGRIDGVVHAAGVPGMGLIQFKSPKDATVALRPKVAGTLALLDCVSDWAAEERPDFVVLFSSITSVTGGGPGQVDYCAANAYLDALAQASATGDTTVRSIGWGEWQWNAWDAGLNGYTPETREFFQANRRRFGISGPDGWHAFQRVLGSGQPHVVVSTQDFRALAALSGRFTIETVLGLGRQGRSRHARPELGTSFLAPTGEVEKTIADLWCTALGLTDVGVHDNFFELGGNSLLGVELMARMCTELGRPTLAPHVLYVAPTVRALAEVLTGSTETTWIDDRRDRGAMRRDTIRRRSA